LKKDFAMSSKDYKPWWMKVSDYATPAEREEFIRGVGGAKPGMDKGILYALIAGYVGGTIARRTGNKK
jgi:hypothetical protein